MNYETCGKNYFDWQVSKRYDKIKKIYEQYSTDGFVHIYIRNIETQKQFKKICSIYEEEIDDLNHLINILFEQFYRLKCISDINSDDFNSLQMGDLIIDDGLLNRTIQKTSNMSREITELRLIIQRQKVQIEKLYNAFKTIDDATNIDQQTSDIETKKMEAENLLKKISPK